MSLSKGVPAMFERSASSNSKPAAAPQESPEGLCCVQCKEPTTESESNAVFKDRKTGVWIRRCHNCNKANAKIGRIPCPAIRDTYWKMDAAGKVPLVCNPFYKISSHHVSQIASHVYNASLY